MVAKPLAVGILCAAFVLGSQAQLIVVNNNAVDKRIENDGGIPFDRVDDGEEGGISIVGPVNPDKPGASIDEAISQIFGQGGNGDDGGINIVGPVQGAGNKVTEDPWQAFNNPNNTNAFGQTFPKPEDGDVGTDNTGPSTASGSIGEGLPGFTSSYEFPGIETTAAPSSHNSPSTSGHVTFPITSAPTTQRPTTTTKKYGGLGGIGEGLGSIFGWGKHTTKKPQTSDKNKDPVKEAVDKAKESVKEAKDKIVEAGKDVLEAGMKIKESLIPGLGFLGGKHRN